jgi:hypothetical protein
MIMSFASDSLFFFPPFSRCHLTPLSLHFFSPSFFFLFILLVERIKSSSCSYVSHSPQLPLVSHFV